MSDDLYSENSKMNKFLQELKIANELVSKYLETNPVYDYNDLFRIALNSLKSEDQLLSTGLRRRLISGI